MTVKKNSPGGCVKRKANGAVSPLQVARPATNREPRKSVELFDAGSSEKSPVCESDVRMDQLGCVDKLRTIRKAAQNLNDDKKGGLSTAKLRKKSSSSWWMMHTNMNGRGGGCCLNRDLVYLQESNVESSISRTRKRMSRHPTSSSHVKNAMGDYAKVSTTKKVGGSHKLFWERPSKLLKKVDAVASPHALLGAKCMHASFKDRSIGNSEMDLERERPIVDTRCIPIRSIECNGAESSECSVASCSATTYPFYDLSCQYKLYPRQDMDDYIDDAESSCNLGYRKECSFPDKEELAAEIHKLELHAYRTTMEALHASGPLSWEQEALMTNLRLNLHISNDEHLLELRKLVSSQNF